MPLARTLATSEVTAKGRSNGYTARLEWPPSLRQVHSELPCSMMATKRFETGQEHRRMFENQEECLRKSPRRFPRGEDMFIRSCRVQWWQLKTSETVEEPRRRSEHPTSRAMRLSQRASSHATTGSNKQRNMAMCGAHLALFSASAGEAVAFPCYRPPEITAAHCVHFVIAL